MRPTDWFITSVNSVKLDRLVVGGDAQPLDAMSETPEFVRSVNAAVEATFVDLCARFGSATRRPCVARSEKEGPAAPAELA